jgi:signal transduction histidine kinase
MEAMARRTLREIACCAISAAYGLAGLLLVVFWLVPSVAASVSVLGTAVGLLCLAGGLCAARLLAALQRRVLSRFAGITIDALPRLERAGGPLAWLGRRLTDGAAWRAVAYTVIRLPLTAVQWSVVVFSAFGVFELLFPVEWPLLGLHAPGPGEQPAQVFLPVPFGDLAISSWPGTFLASLAGTLLLVGAVLLARLAVAADTRLAHALLRPGGLDRRVRELQRTRSLAVDGAAAALRQVERDLHDGAQVRLVSLALNLGMAREKAGAGAPDLAALRELLAAAHGEAAGALTDLRDLARGIHPPVLDNGLPDALASLAAASAIPVRVTADLPRRPSPAIEAIAYFCAAELVANAVKHSFANEIAIELHSERWSDFALTVTDDGVGGADVARGSGLSGLAERVSTVDGGLSVSSPPGGPTVVTALLPMEA